MRTCRRILCHLGEGGIMADEEKEFETVDEEEFFEGFVDEDDEDEEDDEPERTISPNFSSTELRTSVNPVGRVNLGNELDAYRLWVMKCLLTERYKYLAYDTDFGVGLNEILESDDDRDIVESEVEREITEALEVDERTASVEDFSFSWQGDELRVEFTVESVYGDEEMITLSGGDSSGRDIYFRTS